MLAVVDGDGQNEVSGPTVLSWGACAMVRNGDVDVANCGSVPLNTIINSSLNRSQVPLSTSSPQPSVFQTMSSGSSTGPERITKSSSRCCFSMKRLSFLTHVSHRTLLCAVGFSLLSGPSSACLGLQISRFPAASAVGRSIGALSHIHWSSSELSGGRGHASRNP